MPKHRDIIITTGMDIVRLPAPALATIDALRGGQPAQLWIAEAMLRLARQQLGQHPGDPIGWADLALVVAEDRALG